MDTLLLQQCTFQVQCLFRKLSVLNTLHWYGPQADNTNPKLQIIVIYLLKDGEKEMIRSTTEIGEKESKNNQKDQYDHIHHIHLIKAALCTASLDQKVVFPINTHNVKCSWSWKTQWLHTRQVCKPWPAGAERTNMTTIHHTKAALCTASLDPKVVLP